jgi:hypothetical protein
MNAAPQRINYLYGGLVDVSMATGEKVIDYSAEALF